MNESDPPNRTPPPVSLSFLVSQFGAHAAQSFARALRALDLRPQDAGLLRMLSVRPGMTQVETSETFGVLPSRLVALLDALETRGLVRRARDAEDRRKVRLFLTDDGRKAARAIAALTEAMDEGLFRALGKDQRAMLAGLLSKLVEAQGLQPGVHPAYRDNAED